MGDRIVGCGAWDMTFGIWDIWDGMWDFGDEI